MTKSQIEIKLAEAQEYLAQDEATIQNKKDRFGEGATFYERSVIAWRKSHVAKFKRMLQELEMQRVALVGMPHASVGLVA